MDLEVFLVTGQMFRFISFLALSIPYGFLFIPTRVRFTQKTDDDTYGMECEIFV